MFERLLFVAVFAALGVGFYQWYIRQQLRRIASQRFSDPILAGAVPGIPAIVYFTTPMCVPCRTQQQPALLRLKNELGEAVQIIQIDATEQPDAADRWGVMSAPTTFVLDRTGNPGAVNHGVANEIKLKQQLMAVMTTH